MLDGLLHHESSLVIREHYADTGGAIEHVFGLCHLLGFRFAPRLRDLPAYPRQNALARALRVIGCLERTLFILDWISDPALRRRSNAGLNKGEARNALTRALFFHRHGEIRDRTFENQRYRASGLNLTFAYVLEQILR